MVSCAGIETSVRRYERQCAGYFGAPDWRRWLLQDLLNEFKTISLKKAKEPPGVLQKGENGAFIILNKMENRDDKGVRLRNSSAGLQRRHACCPR